MANLSNLAKSINEVRSELYGFIEQVQEEYIEKGYLPARMNLNKGIIRGILETQAYGIWQLYAFMNQAFLQAVPSSATGKYLDIHGSQVGLERNKALKAVGKVAFSRASSVPSNRNIPIPLGSIVRTLPDGRGNVYRYITTEHGVIPANQTSIDVLVESEEYGTFTNAAPGQISELVKPIEGVGCVTNGSTWLISEGANEEDDVSFFRRYKLEWASQAGITRAAYEAAALSVSGVVDVFVDDQHPRGEGTVDIVVQGSAGIPTANLLEAVEKAVASSIIINDDVKIKAPIEIEIDVILELVLLSGEPNTSIAKASDYITKLFSCDNSVPYFGIGADVVRDRIAAGIINLSGIKKIIWTSPSTDITIHAGELAKLSSLTITSSWATEK